MKFCTWPNILIPIIIQIRLNRGCRVVCNLASFQKMFFTCVCWFLRFVVIWYWVTQYEKKVFGKIGRSYKTTFYSYWSTKPLRYQHPITLEIYQISFVNRYLLRTSTIWIAGFSVNAACIAKCARNVILEANRYIFILSLQKAKCNILLFQRLKHQ